MSTHPTAHGYSCPYHTIPYDTIPYHTIPYHNIPYHTIPYHTILFMSCIMTIIVHLLDQLSCTMDITWPA